MKKNYFSALLIPVCLLIGQSALHAQKAFQRGSLMVSISEGSTIGNYKTTGSSTSSASATGMTYRSSGPVAEDDSHPTTHHHCTPGTRDPLIIEYGITNKVSLGITTGNDIFNVKPSQFYGFTLTDDNTVKVKTSEVTFDGAYHFYVNKRLDLSAFGGAGFFSVAFNTKEQSDSKLYSYTANGSIVRGGLRVRYYFFRHLGAFGQISSYAGKCSPGGVKTNTVAQDYKTQISGSTIEAGLCYRFIR